MNRRLWTWKEVAGAALAALIVGSLIYVTLFPPHSRTNHGFGPEWDCRSPSPGYDPVCLKKSAPKPSP